MCYFALFLDDFHHFILCCFEYEYNEWTGGVFVCLNKKTFIFLIFWVISYLVWDIFCFSFHVLFLHPLHLSMSLSVHFVSAPCVTLFLLVFFSVCDFCIFIFSRFDIHMHISHFLFIKHCIAPVVALMFFSFQVLLAHKLWASNIVGLTATGWRNLSSKF